MKTKRPTKRGAKPKEPNRRDNYSIDSEPGANGQFLKFSKKQTRSWSKIDKPLLEHIQDVIDSSTKIVKSKPRLANDPTVNDLLDPLTVRLKAKLKDLKVPKTKCGEMNKTRALVAHLEGEAAKLVNQELELEKAIRQEERKIEALEDAELVQRGQDSVQLCLKVPETVLQLPKMTGSPLEP